MDYKYIEQLLERYWEAQTTEAEEAILKTFFAQPDVPAALERYRPLFAYEEAQQSVGLGADFDERLLKLIAEPTKADEPTQQMQKPSPTLRVKARRINGRISFRPFFQAAAAVAIVVLVGIGAQKSFNRDTEAWDYNSNNYSDTYNNPAQAYHVVESGLNMFQRTASADSTKEQSPEVEKDPIVNEE